MFDSEIKSQFLRHTANTALRSRELEIYTDLFLENTGMEEMEQVNITEYVFNCDLFPLNCSFWSRIAESSVLGK